MGILVYYVTKIVQIRSRLAKKPAMVVVVVIVLAANVSRQMSLGRKKEDFDKACPLLLLAVAETQFNSR
jgi:hypothetical protein